MYKQSDENTIGEPEKIDPGEPPASVTLNQPATSPEWQYPKFHRDKDEVKAAASGRWLEVLNVVAGIDAALLDGRNHPCPSCGGTDRFRMIDADAGAVLCNVCFAKGNGDGFAAVMHYRRVGFSESLRLVASHLGLAPKHRKSPTTPSDPIETIARKKNVDAGALRMYGAKASGTHAITIPMYSPTGSRCSESTITTSGGKGLYTAGKPVGVFLPHDANGTARLPKPGETWLVCEGPKDPAALWSLGFLAIGLPGNLVNMKFARLFRGVNVIFIPDRDRAGNDGAEHGARLLLKKAATVRVAVLPAEFTETNGADVRDILKQRDGELLLRQAIDDAVSFEPAGSGDSSLPTVMLPGGSASITYAATSLGRLLDATGKYFHRGGAVTRVERDEEGALKLAVVKPAAICSAFEKVATLKKIRMTKEGGEETVRSICSESSGRLIIAAASFTEALSPIKVLSRCPVLIERDGKLIQVAGYDRQSGILASGTPASDITLAESIDMCCALLAEFQFATAGDRARALAALITPSLVFGGLLGGVRVPIDLGEADDSQSGKGFRNKLTTAVYNSTPSIVAQRTTGGVGSVQEIFDKALIAGATFISFDNFRGKLDFSGLESFCTEPNYTARTPYSPGVEIDPRRTILMLTSNKAEMTVDLANRSSCVRILKRPGYEFQKYLEGDLLDHVMANQPRYLGAVFAIIREWHRRGKPELPATSHDFRRWARVLSYIVRDILKAGELLDGHRNAQERIASPDLSWLRDVALSVQKANKLGEWMRASQLLQIILDNGINTPGIAGELDSDDESTWLNATRTIGRKMGKLFNVDELTIDNFRVERHKTLDSSGREKTEYVFSTGFPNSPNDSPMAPPMETLVSPIPPIDSQDNTRTHAHTRMHACEERVQPIGGIGESLGEGTTEDGRASGSSAVLTLPESVGVEEFV